MYKLHSMHELQHKGQPMITYHEGNLFDSTADALAHGCNAAGKMDRGIAREFKERYPEMFAYYRQQCEEKKFLPGTAHVYVRPEKPHIVNLVTQRTLTAREAYVDSALDALPRLATEFGLARIAMPRIASGLGGLEWQVVHRLIKKHFEKSPLEIEMWALPSCLTSL